MYFVFALVIGYIWNDVTIWWWFGSRWVQIGRICSCGKNFCGCWVCGLFVFRVLFWFLRLFWVVFDVFLWCVFMLFRVIYWVFWFNCWFGKFVVFMFCWRLGGIRLNSFSLMLCVWPRRLRAGRSVWYDRSVGIAEAAGSNPAPSTHTDFSADNGWTWHRRPIQRRLVQGLWKMRNCLPD